jgi:phospholipase C
MDFRKTAWFNFENDVKGVSMSAQKILAAILSFAFISQASAGTQSGRYFDRAIFVMFENTNYATALNQPFFGKLARDGANFSNFMAMTHPSQGNYVALTSGSLNGVRGDGHYDIDSSNIADLLESKNLTWKVYAEDYPGNCFIGMSSKNYARKHNPFISYLNIQQNPSRCANIVNAAQFDVDAANGTLPNYVFYVPNDKNSGHDTGVAFADKWYGQKFGPLVASTKFMDKTVLISTFDESGASAKNQIYASVVGPAVSAGDTNCELNLFSLLKLIEENWSLGNLGRSDATAPFVPNIWK